MTGKVTLYNVARSDPYFSPDASHASGRPSLASVLSDPVEKFLKREALHDAPEEAAALDLRRALTALDALTGRDGSPPSEEVLDAIFSRFCVGK